MAYTSHRSVEDISTSCDCAPLSSWEDHARHAKHTHKLEMHNICIGDSGLGVKIHLNMYVCTRMGTRARGSRACDNGSGACDCVVKACC